MVCVAVDSDRALFFPLNVREQEYFGQLRTPGTRANFLLQLGYFRARQRFFVLTPALVTDDLAYLREKYLDGKPVPGLKISKSCASANWRGFSNTSASKVCRRKSGMIGRGRH